MTGLVVVWEETQVSFPTPASNNGSPGTRSRTWSIRICLGRRPGLVRTTYFLGGFFLDLVGAAVGVVVVEAAKIWLSWVPLGEPSPVQGSQPGPAE